MTIRDLPKIEAREGVATETDAEAVSRWNPALVSAAAQGDDTISILDVIGGDIFGDGVTASRIAAALRRNIGKPVSVQINSPGGDLFEGLAIYNMLREHPAKVTVDVIGVAASAASLIAMAGDEIRIGTGAHLMIHQARAIARGTTDEMQEVVEALAKFDAGMVEVYAARTGLKSDELDAMLRATTWLSADDAIAKGFADGKLDGSQIKTAKAEGPRDVKAIRVVDAALAKQGIPRTERRSLLAEIKGGKPGAASDDGTLDAAALAEAQSLITLMRA